jgi:hypothetical protein
MLKNIRVANMPPLNNPIGVFEKLDNFFSKEYIGLPHGFYAVFINVIQFRVPHLSTATILVEP